MAIFDKCTDFGKIKRMEKYENLNVASFRAQQKTRESETSNLQRDYS